jgi:uncharacterized protein YdeI (YjbR/CyaY-like superfamily)
MAEQRQRMEQRSARPEQRPFRRERYAMPEDIRQVLRERVLDEAYNARPPYQQNDYIGWITSAVRPETRAKRLNQMLDELKAGERYMNMLWRPRDRA